MIDKEFGRIMKRMEAGLRQEVTDLQFEEYLNCFGKENAVVFERAIQRVIDTQKWIPVPAQLKVFIKQIQEEDEARAESTRKVRADPDLLCNMSPEQKEAEFKRRAEFGRFMHWCDERRKFPKFDGDYQIMRKDFDENYKGWKPRERKAQKRVEKIGNLVGNVTEDFGLKEEL